MFLALTEIRRNRSRFLLIVAIIALITALTLFIAALADGLGSGNIQGLQKLDADLLVFQGKLRTLTYPQARFHGSAFARSVASPESTAWGHLDSLRPPFPPRTPWTIGA